MKMKDYIIDKINELSSYYPTTKVGYYVDEFSNSNYIKVLPSDEFDNNKDYQKFEANFIIDFIDKFPYEEIVFISEKSLIDLSEPLYEIEGELYSKNEVFWNTDVWSNDFEIDFNLTLHKSVNEIVGNYNSLSDILDYVNKENSINPIHMKAIEVKQAEGNSYALAA